MASNRRVIADWGTWMTAEGLSTRTIKHRTETMRFFVADGLDALHADDAALVALLARHRDDWGASTRSNYYRVLRAWYLWLRRRGLRADIPTDLMRAPKQPIGIPRPVSTGEFERVLAVCNRRRTRAMVLLAAYEGLRAHEIAKVRGEDVRGGRLRVIGKGEVDDSVPLHPAVAALAGEFPASGWWFPSYDYPGEPVTSGNVSAVISGAFKRAGVAATAHQLRHWFGTQSLRSSGGNVRVAQVLLRHASLATTQIYTRVENDEATAAVLALPSVNTDRPVEVRGARPRRASSRPGRRAASA